MLKNILIISWRTLSRNKLYSFVNIGSLTTGIAACILIGLYLHGEVTYDTFHMNANRIVRATTEYTMNGAVNQVGMSASMAGPRLASAFPQIESYVRIRNFEPFAIRHGDVNFIESRFLFADSAFFHIFSFPLLEGDARTALKGPGKIVLSRSMEKKYFGDEKALGKTLTVGGSREYLVTAVAEDAPINSQIQFNFIASYESLPNANSPSWNVQIYATYFLLHDLDHVQDMEKNIKTFVAHQKDSRQGLTGNDYLTYHLEPITSVHLYSRLAGLEPNGSITYVTTMGLVALLILGVACVNYTNLATAQSAHRIAEIGIRKALGSAWWQLFWQFIGESTFLNLISFLLAIAVASAVLPWFNILVERQLVIRDLLQPQLIMIMLATYVTISLAAGAYPASFLSRLQVIKILKAGFSFTGGTGVLRKSLIIFQFVVSVFLIVSTVIVFQQLSFIRNKNLGYNQDHIIVFPVDQIIRTNFQSIKELLEPIPDVASVSCGAEEITNIGWDDELRTVHDSSTPPVFVNASPTDYDFVRTMGLQIIAGRDFNRSDWIWTDSSARTPEPQTFYLLNESAVKAIGLTPGLAVGRIVYRGMSPGRVVGVVKDFNFAPLRESIKPLLIFLDANHAHVFQAYVRISGQGIPKTMKAIESVWNNRITHRPFQYHFLDDNYNRLYHGEEQTARMFSTFSGLAILLACVGLLTLAAYSSVQRAKEIGIRKVFGAGVWQIVVMVSGEFMRLIAVAVLIAFPIAWMFMNNWLQSFVYRVTMDWWVFALAGLSVAVIAAVTVGFQAIRAAQANPVKSLRTE
jgi:putative ABC transport system permease protein